ncbi:TLC domain-containing protein [Crassisporium funariophilum]|nr:TLC domain-containing protein [Crassisporium funariophilum]
MAFLERFVSGTLGLTKFPPYLSTFYWSFLGFLLIHQVIAPYFSSKYFPVAFAGKNRAARNNWSIHVVSQVHVVIIVPYALWVILNEKPDRGAERAFGWDENVGYVHAIACGYFLWDTLDAIINFIDPGFVAHGIACFAIYTMSYKPFVAYYGLRCLLWETSTFFLNNHWFLDKTNRTGSRLQLINGFFLLTSFLFVRIIYGGSISLQFFFTLLEVRHEIPLAYLLIYGLGNIVLQGLNWFWFYKMIQSLRKRFGTSGERTKLIGEDQVATGPADGHAAENGNSS